MIAMTAAAREKSKVRRPKVRCMAPSCGIAGQGGRDEGAGGGAGSGGRPGRGGVGGAHRLGGPVGLDGGHPLGSAAPGRGRPPRQGRARHRHLRGPARSGRCVAGVGGGPGAAPRVAGRARLRGGAPGLPAHVAAQPAPAGQAGGGASPGGWRAAGRVASSAIRRAAPTEVPMANLLRGGRGRPLHPALVHFPIALYPASLLFDGISYLVDDGNPFVKGAFTLLVTALVISIAAVVAGFSDFLRIPVKGSAWRLAVTHMTLQLVTGGLFLANTILRSRDLDVTTSPSGPVILSAIGVVVLGVGALLGGDLVYRHGQRVEAPREVALEPGPEEPPATRGDERPAHQ